MFQLDVLESKRRRRRRRRSSAPSVCLSVSLFLSPPPLWLFHLSLTNSSSGSQPLADSLSRQTKNHGNNHWKSPSGSKKGPPSLAAPAPSALFLFFYFFAQIWLKWEIGINKQMSSLKVGDRSFFFFDQAQAQASDDIRIEEFISSPLAERGDCSTHTHTQKCSC